MKPNELKLIHLVYTKRKPYERSEDDKSVRDMIEISGIPSKQCWYYLEKWCEKDWYEYGVNLELGWLTPKGKKKFKEILENDI